MEFDVMIKLGLAYKHTYTKAEQMGDRKTEDTVVRRMVQEAVNRVKQGARGKQEGET